MKPLVVVDLESLTMPGFARAMIKTLHEDTAPERPLVVVGPDEELPEAAGIIITGSDRMLHEDTAWAEALSRRVVAAAEADTPVLGICFGHQMLCWHFGGKLARWGEPKMGITPVMFQTGGPFAAGASDIFHVHADHVVDAGDLEVLGTGGFGGIQATRHPTLPIWTIQGHPEARSRHAEALPPEKKAQPLPPGVDLGKIDTPDGKAILARFGKMLRH